MALRRGIAVALSLVSLTALSAVPAAADPPPPPPGFGATGTGSVGWSNGVVDGRSLTIGRLAQCAVGQTRSGFTPGAWAGNFVGFGWGRSSCDRDRWGGASVQVAGSAFRLDGLRRFGGPAIRVSNFSLGCHAGWFGSQTNFSMSGMFGVRVPARVPANYTVFIPGRQAGDPPLAKVMINEVVRPTPPDGSVTVNLLHVWLFPNNPSIHTGEFVLGSVSCSP